MVEVESFNILSYVFKDVIYGTLLGLKDSCLGIIDVLFNAAKAYFSKGVQHDSQEKNLSASASQKKSKNNDAYGDVLRCSLFNTILFCLAFFVLFLIKKSASLIIFWNPDESSWIYSVINVAVQLVTVIPIYIISKAANIFWLQDLSNKAYHKHYGSPVAFSLSHIGYQISDVTFSIVIECLLIVQANILEYLLPPRLALISSVVHYSLLNALYAFEYLWGNRGWSLHTRIRTLVDWFFSVCYPFFIVGAIIAPSEAVKQRGPSLKVFFFVIWFTSYLSKVISTVWRQRKSR
ncbi:Etoposide-induced protein 2.4 [Armadillidium nasatum]|uniref:Etoposide-induced protein 2.4 n=1 Tax=Armadillidium nasatum TaxID=96803 RepID=A0A5N5SWM5_9CRUS|nr:Etoposide-induced protein 2.4 [Armadillidium nasatum]